VELTGPVYPVALAVMIVEPALTAVASPEALTVATDGVLEVQVTELVIFCVEGRFALPYVPIAVNCAVCPTATDCVAGVTRTEFKPLLPHPASNRTRQLNESAPK
jgi:hypothetical protein